MNRWIIRILATAFACAYIFPKIDGISFTGAFFPDGVVYGVLFAITAWIVTRIFQWASVAFSIGTLGAGLLIVVPLWLFGFWLLPAVQLMVCAWLFPANLAVNSWFGAIVAGLILMFINGLTHSRSSS